jgi:hypothetical protein
VQRNLKIQQKKNLHLDFNLIWYTLSHIHGLSIIQVLEFWRENSKNYTIMICLLMYIYVMMMMMYVYIIGLMRFFFII